jgi:hypothetical protein
VIPQSWCYNLYAAQRFFAWRTWRTAHRGLHGPLFAACTADKTCPLDVPCGTGQEVACFEYTHSYADLNKLRRLAKTSTARWILIRQSGADDEIKHCLELFQDQRTFAVSRQAGYSPPLPPFFRAPVRQLRPGEACRVLAPVSELILVDRAKLVALGIPRTSHPGTAWMMLFWKAAAAGFTCYSVGGGEINMLPEWPVHESEFVTRAISEPDFLRLGPRQPDLCRGTISFMIGAGRPLRTKPLVLLVSPYLPYRFRTAALSVSTTSAGHRPCPGS